MKRKTNLSIQKTCHRFTLVAGIFFTGVAPYALEVNWHGASCLTIEDSTNRIIIDPFVSRPPLWKVITNTELTPNKKLVAKVFSGLQKKNHILITHTHYDHVLDLPVLAGLYPKAKIYGPKNLDALSKIFKISKERIGIITGKQELELGTFKLTTYPISHSTLPLGYAFAKGEMDPSAMKLGAFDYKSNESIALSLEHTNGTILLHPSAEGKVYKNIKEVDLLIVGLTSRDLSSLKTMVINKIKANNIFAIHHDNFFNSYEGKLSKMPFYPTLNNFPNKKLPININVKNRIKSL